jgi:bacterioferritin
MAINGYERYIQSIKDTNVKGELKKIQQDHKQHAIKIAERIQNLGGRPVESEGVMGKAASVMSGIKDMGMMSDTSSILKEARRGEDNGIKMADEVVRGDLDPDSAVLVRDILNDDRNHLDRLECFTGPMEGIH